MTVQAGVWAAGEQEGRALDYRTGSRSSAASAVYAGQGDSRCPQDRKHSEHTGWWGLAKGAQADQYMQAMRGSTVLFWRPLNSYHHLFKVTEGLHSAPFEHLFSDCKIPMLMNPCSPNRKPQRTKDLF